MGDPKLYATYVELVREMPSGRARRQYIILPPLMPSVASGQGVEPQPYFLYFYRQQEKPEHRAVWKSRFDKDNEFVHSLVARVQRSQSAGWTVSPLVTCEVHPSELLALFRNPQTPYKIKERLEKVARQKYGYTV